MPKEESFREALERIHRDTAPALGLIAGQLERRTLSRAQMRAWADTLRRGADELDRLVSRLDAGR